MTSRKSLRRCTTTTPQTCRCDREQAQRASRWIYTYNFLLFLGNASVPFRRQRIGLSLSAEDQYHPERKNRCSSPSFAQILLRNSRDPVATLSGRIVRHRFLIRKRLPTFIHAEVFLTSSVLYSAVGEAHRGSLWSSLLKLTTPRFNIIASLCGDELVLSFSAPRVWSSAVASPRLSLDHAARVYAPRLFAPRARGSGTRSRDSARASIEWRQKSKLRRHCSRLRTS